MIKIGKLEINGAALAPMAGFTDSAFREICSEMGAGLLVSEMISAKALCFKDKKTEALISFTQKERPFALQLFGSDTESVYEATKILCEHKPQMIDINMGCPVPKIVSNGCGSALLNDRKKAEQIVSAAVKAADVPVSVKIRIGFDNEHIVASEFAKALEGAGASLITVHGRTREQMYRPGVNFEAIKSVRDAVKIPVIANGDITSFEDKQRMLEITGCDEVMIGRAALGNPFIFKELCDENYKEPSFLERMENLKKLAELGVKNKGERLAMLELRRHMPFFFKQVKNAAEIRRRSTVISSFEEFLSVIDYALDLNSI